MIARVNLVLDVPLPTEVVEPVWAKHPDSTRPENPGFVMTNEDEVTASRVEAAVDAEKLAEKFKADFGDQYVNMVVTEVRDS